MSRKWTVIDAAYLSVEARQPEILDAMAALSEGQLQNMKLHADILLEGLYDLPENIQKMQLFLDMVRSVYGVGLFMEVAIMHKAKVSEQNAQPGNEGE